MPPLARHCRARELGCVSVYEEVPVILPNGRSQKVGILKAEHQQNIKDAADLADQLKVDLEKNDCYVLSMATLKSTDDIERRPSEFVGLRHN
jgi:hypothetical protein